MNSASLGLEWEVQALGDAQGPAVCQELMDKGEGCWVQAPAELGIKKAQKRGNPGMMMKGQPESSEESWNN